MADRDRAASMVSPDSEPDPCPYPHTGARRSIRDIMAPMRFFHGPDEHAFSIQAASTQA